MNIANLKFRMSDYTFLSLIVIVSTLQTYLYNQVIYGSCNKLLGFLYYLIIWLYVIAMLLGVLIFLTSIHRNIGKATFYLIISFAIFSFFFVNYRTDYARYIKGAWARKYMITKIGDCCVSYIDETNIFEAENVKWQEGLKKIIDSDTNIPLSKLYLYSFNSHASTEYTFLPEKVNIILFEKPSDSSQVVEDVSQIKLSNKRYLFLYSDEHLVYRYIPHKNKLFLEKTLQPPADKDNLDSPSQNEKTPIHM